MIAESPADSSGVSVERYRSGGEAVDLAIILLKRSGVRPGMVEHDEGRLVIFAPSIRASIIDKGKKMLIF